MSRAGGVARVHLHVGASKTGTSALQRGLWSSVEPLRAAGLGLPLVGRAAHVQQVLRPLGWVASRGFVEPVRRRRLDPLTRTLEEPGTAHVLLSNEDLAELDDERVALLHEVLTAGGAALEVVLTARTWSRQLPSEYQQFLKHRLTTDYATWLDDVRLARTASGEHFRLRQDFAATAARWARVLPAEHVHVVVAPSRPLTAGSELFCGVVGVPPAAVAVPEDAINASFGAVEAEVYRRLNASLPRVFDDYEADYYPGVRIPLVTGVLPREASARLRLPPEHLGWVAEESSRQVEALRAGGYRLHGDVDLLLPAESDTAPLPPVAEEAVAAAAVAALGRALARPHREARRRRRGGAGGDGRAQDRDRPRRGLRRGRQRS